MNRSLPAVRFAVGVVLALTLATPSFAQRHRIVKRFNPEAASLSGTVIDAVTRAPIAEAFVRVGNKGVATAADGKYSVSALTANAFTVKVTRWGYVDHEQIVTLAAGANQLDVALQPGPIVTVKMENGTIYSLDFESLQFGYFVAFVGFRGGPEFHLCLPSGEEKTVTTAEIKSVTFPGVRTETTSCCSLAPGAIARITLKDDTIVDATIKEACNGADFFVRGRNRTTGADEAIKIADVESVTF